MARHKACAGCTKIGSNYVFMPDIGAYMCDICVDQVFSAAYCDLCAKETSDTEFTPRGNLCGGCVTIMGDKYENI